MVPVPIPPGGVGGEQGQGAHLEPNSLTPPDHGLDSPTRP